MTESDRLPDTGPDSVSSSSGTAVEELLAALADDFAGRLRRRESVTVDEYISQHPQIEDRIRHVLAAVEVIEHTRSFDVPRTSEGPGSIIGRYKLLERIGEGGFGVVFMAEQQHPILRKVALKLIKPGLDSQQVVARLEAERQALALMDHPNIAKVFDAGVTDTGRPYFVMELVKGVPITQYCDRKQLSLDERLKLFTTVCHAVQHAHQKAIIHRDIKPTNVLIAEYDELAVAKVIDFGVAKAVGARLTEKTLFTEFGQLVGTLEYMSPEQAKMNQLDIDTRSDIYSLGVLLYELLAGTTPLDRKQIKDTSILELLRIVREQDAPTLSNRLSTTVGLPAIAANRGLEPAKLTKIVRGELDWIVMKALEKERHRRYETASAFAADVERYLADEPVEACPPSTWYRFRKFAHRQRRALATAAVIVLAVLLTAAGSAGLIWRANQNLREALVREHDTFERERRNSYSQRIALADREWSANNLERMEQLLDECPEDLQGWEWHFLKRRRFSTFSPLPHDSQVLCGAFSRDGRYLVTGTQAGELRFWQTETGQELQKWSAHRHGADCVTFSPDGRYLASGCWDGTVKLWDMKKVLRGEIEEPLFQFDHDSRVWGVAFSHDGRLLATASGLVTKQCGEAKVWDLNSHRELLAWEFSTKVASVQFSPYDRQLAILTSDALRVWDFELHQELFAYDIEDGDSQSLAYSPDGRWLATAGGLIAVYPNREITIHDAQTGSVVNRLRGHVGGLRSVAFSPDGKRLVSAGLDHNVRLWDPVSAQEVLTLRGHLDNIWCVTFSQDGYLLASTSVDNTVRIWDATPLEMEPRPEYQTLTGHQGAVTDVAFHPLDGNRLVTASTDGSLREWDARTGMQLDVRDIPSSIYPVTVALSQDGKRMAVTTSMQDGASVRVWDTEKKEELRLLRGNIAQDHCVAFSADGQFVASGGFDYVVRIWDSATGELLRTLTDHQWPVMGLDFSPDRQYLASGGSDRSVRIWNWTTGEAIKVLEPCHASRVQGVAFNRDGTRLASASWDRTIKIWDTKTWTLLDELPDPSGAALCVAFGLGDRLAWGSTDSTVKIWDGPETEIQLLRGHASWVQAVDFSPDGEWIASASLDGTAKIWRAPPQTTLTSGNASVTASRIAPRSHDRSRNERQPTDDLPED